VNVTVPVYVRPIAVAVTVRVPRSVDVIDAISSPRSFVMPVAGSIVSLPSVVTVTSSFAIGIPASSRSRTIASERWVPFASTRRGVTRNGCGVVGSGSSSPSPVPLDEQAARMTIHAQARIP
jgi:hypothetical protein